MRCCRSSPYASSEPAPIVSCPEISTASGPKPFDASASSTAASSPYEAPAPPNARRHRVAERFLRGDGAAQRGRQPRVGRECFAARERAERGVDDGSLRARDAPRELGARVQLRDRRRRAVDQALDEPGARRGELALDTARGAVERRDVAGGVLVAGGRERLRSGGVSGGAVMAGAAQYN